MIKFEEIKKRFILMFSLDLRSLALMRVLYGAVLLFDIIDRARYLNTFYTDFGVMPRNVLLNYYNNSWFASVHLISGAWQFQAILFLVAAFFAVMLLVGYKTKLATIVSWLLLISLQTRNPLVLQGGDALMRLGLFWAIFLPWDKYFSVDKVLNTQEEPKAKKTENSYFSGATVAFILQIAILYWFAAMFKTGAEWFNGTAVYYALSIDQFATPLGRFLLNFPVLLKTLTFGTLIVEAIFPFFLFMPFATATFRLIATITFIILHTGFALNMHLGPFSFVAITCLAALLPTLFWDKIEKKLKDRKKSKITIYYDNGCGFCTKAINYIRVFLIIPLKNIVPASKDKLIFSTMMKKNSWIVIDEKNKKYFKFEAFKKIASASPVLFIFVPIFNLYVINKFGNWLYEKIAKKNSKLCFPIKKFKEKKITEKPNHAQFIALNIIPVILIFYVLAWNIMEYSPNRFQLPLKEVGWALRLDQRWNMFSPRPMTEDGWYVIPGKLKNGESIDLFKNGGPVSYDKPADVAKTYDGERWRKYLMNLWSKNFSDYRLYYGQYICKSWNNSHSEDQQLMTFDIVYVLEATLPNYIEPTPSPTIIWQHHCFDNINQDYI